MKKDSLKYEQAYRTNAEPWNYSKSGAEKLRHKQMVVLAKKFVLSPQNVVDVGCSLGQFTELLTAYSSKVYGIDISETAVQKCKDTLGKKFQHTDFQAITLDKATFLPHSFDVIFYCDGINEHQLEGELLEKTMQNIRLFLKPSGIVIFTDYLGHRNFEAYRQKIKQFDFHVLHEELLHDRLWFQVKSVFKIFLGNKWVDAFLANEKIAQFFAKISSKMGEKGSKHLCIIAK